MIRYSEEFGHIDGSVRTLRLQNTGNIVLMDRDDWEKAKHCGWYINEDFRLVNKSGVYFEDYVGLKGKRKSFSKKNHRYTRDQYQ